MAYYRPNFRRHSHSSYLHQAHQVLCQYSALASIADGGFGQTICYGSCREESVRDLTSLRRFGRLLTCSNTANIEADTAKLAAHPKMLPQWLWLFLTLFSTHTYL